LKLESTVLGIPLALILFIFVNAIIVLIPLIIMQTAIMNELSVKADKVDVQTIRTALLPTPTEAPTATPSATPVVRQGFVSPTVGVVKPLQQIK